MKRQWRKVVKKLQRKRRRQQIARERDKKLEEDELAKLKDPAYKQWLENQEYLEHMERLVSERQQQENEELWLRRELLAQKQFQNDERKRKAEEKLQEDLRLQQEKVMKERAEVLQRQREEIKKKSDQIAKDFEETMQLMENYLEDSDLRTPEKLRICIESLPGEKQCKFYARTHCCRFDLRCQQNHSRPMVSKVILIRNFFQHRLLDQQVHKEYASAEERIEVSEYDLRYDYEEFCADVWPELERFGKIVNFHTVRNRHAKGHVFVEYKDKRSAMRAFINLQNRYYASKRLKVEFSHISDWRSAACGYYLAHKCANGPQCNALHFIPNPRNKYKAPLRHGSRESSLSQRSETNSVKSQQTPLLSWNTVTENDYRSRDWRWSESPEVEIIAKAATKEDNRKNKSSVEHLPKDNESIVLSSSDSEETEKPEKLKRKSRSEKPANRRNSKHEKRKATSNWGHTPKISKKGMANKFSDKWLLSEDDESIVISSSSSDCETHKEVSRKVNSETKYSTSRNRKEHRKSKHRHHSSSEERHTESPRSSSHHRRTEHKKHKHKSR